MANPKHVKWLLEGAASWNARREQEDFKPDFKGTNIYEKFQQAGQLDKDGYIPLVGINLSNADFRKSSLTTPSAICGADLRQANLWSANFRDAHLPNSKLDGASLAGASFDGANMLGASLAGPDTKMASTTFSRTDLFEADLRNTDVANSYFGHAYLGCAKLAGADLVNADLTGADLADSRPWEAMLFAQNNPTSSARHGSAVYCVADLIEECRHAKRSNAGHALYFRGERTTDWKLRPSVMRHNLPKRKFTLRHKEGEMLIDLMSRRPEDFVNVTSAFGQWVLAQHHGLKTRLLDITRNPLVALFWACQSAPGRNDELGRLHIFSVPRKLVKPFSSDIVRILANFAKLSLGEQNALLGSTWDDLRNGGHCFENLEQGSTQAAMNALYHMIREEKPHFREEIDPKDFFRVFVVEPQQSFQRIRAQSGAFLLSAFHERFERSEILNWNPQVPIYDHSTLVVPQEVKQDILAELRLLNITAESLVPSLDQEAKTITEIHSK